MGFRDFLFDLLFTETGFIDKSLFDLTEGEKWWGTRFSMLESHGYRLRERLRPGWVPPWITDPNLAPESCEDSACNLFPQITDATRVVDGSCVMIKKISKGSNEKSIAVFLSSIKDEKNHCVPIVDTFPDDTDDDIEYIVMPLLRAFNSPPFTIVNEVVDFFRQTLEGIAFLHSLNVAHRDCSDSNIMLDGTSIYPHGFHPVFQDRSRDWMGRAKFDTRSSSPEVKYYFTDFGISTRFNESDKDRLVTGCICQVDVPELSDTVPYDPFLVDIYLIGDVYKRHFIAEYSNLEFLRPLVDLMVQTDPARRPRANDALKRLDSLVSQKSGYFLRWKLLERKTGRFARYIINLKCASREGIFMARKLIAFDPFRSKFDHLQSIFLLWTMTDPLSLAQLIFAIPQLIDGCVSSARTFRNFLKVEGNYRFEFEHAESQMFQLREYVIIIRCTALKEDTRDHLEKVLRRAHHYVDKLSAMFKKWSTRLGHADLDPSEAATPDPGTSGLETTPSEAKLLNEKESSSSSDVGSTDASDRGKHKTSVLRSLHFGLNKLWYLSLGCVSIREALDKLEATNRVLSEFIPISQHMDHLLSHNEDAKKFTILAKKRDKDEDCLIPENLKIKELEEVEEPIFFRVVEPGEYHGCIVEQRYVNVPGDRPGELKETQRLARVLREDKQARDGITDPNVGILRCCGYMLPHSSEHLLVFRLPQFHRARTLRTVLLSPETENHIFEDRIEFALKLATAVHVFHSIGFVHKGIKPEAILVAEQILPPPSDVYQLGTPYLAGFNIARYNESDSGMYKFDRVMNKKLYHHPRQLGKRRPQKYQMDDDIYSLGVCLLEIGLWKSAFKWDDQKKIYRVNDWARGLFADVPRNPQGYVINFELREEENENDYPIDIARKRRLTHMAESMLNTKVNKPYCRAVVACLTFGEQARLTKQNEGYIGSQEFYEKVICELRRAKGY
ncbi:hypothetical protein ACEPAG_3789 [Sanghuangporus baumii]